MPGMALSSKYNISTRIIHIDHIIMKKYVYYISQSTVESPGRTDIYLPPAKYIVPII